MGRQGGSSEMFPCEAAAAPPPGASWAVKTLACFGRGLPGHTAGPGGGSGLLVILLVLCGMVCGAAEELRELKKIVGRDRAGLNFSRMAKYWGSALWRRLRWKWERFVADDPCHFHLMFRSASQRSEYSVTAVILMQNRGWHFRMTDWWYKVLWRSRCDRIVPLGIPATIYICRFTLTSSQGCLHSTNFQCCLWICFLP